MGISLEGGSTSVLSQERSAASVPGMNRSIPVLVILV